jgi:diguanylate cyclase (GGDEF)-like protein/PAS domain S-box-containing protein
MISLAIAFMTVVGAIMIFVLQNVYRERIEYEYITKVTAAAKLSADGIGAENLAKYILHKQEDAEYWRAYIFLEELRESTNAEYIYVQAHDTNGLIYIWGVDSEGRKNLGDTADTEDIDKVTGEPTRDINTITDIETINIANNGGIAYISAGISIEDMQKTIRDTTITLASIVVTALVVLILLVLRILLVAVTLPVKELIELIDNNFAGKKNEEGIEFKHIKPHSEIYLLSKSMLGMHHRVDSLVEGLEKTQAVLTERDSMLGNLNKMSVELLTQTEEEFLDVMVSSSEKAADIAHIDRISISRNVDTPEGLGATQIYRWVRGKGGYLTPLDKLFNNPYSRQIPRWKDVLASGECISGLASQMPEAEALQQFGCLAILAIPIFDKSTFWGFVLFEELYEGHIFSEDETEILRSAGFMLASAMIRQREERLLRETEEYARLMLQATPLSCIMWDKRHKAIDCNEAAITLYGFKDKEDCLKNLNKTYLEKQPDGQDSNEVAKKMMNLAIETGISRFKFENCTQDGKERIQTDVTFARVNRGDHKFVVGYAYDLREYHKILKTLEYKNHLLDTLNQISALLLQYNDANFEDNLRTAMGIMAKAANADRSYIWENYINDGELYCYQTYEWSEGAEPQQGRDILQAVSYKEVIPSWEEAFLKKQCINGIVGQLSPTEYEILSKQGIKSLITVPIYVKGTFWGFVGFDDCHNERVFTEDEEAILRSASELIAEAVATNDLQKSIENLEGQVDKIYIDPLTGIHNRRYLDDRAQPLFQLLSRSGSLLSTMMIDVDNFKKYNDTYGHSEGDICLRNIAQALHRAVSREEDFVVRYGGEEFSVILPNTDTTGAQVVAKRILKEIRDLKIEHRKNEEHGIVTVSIGVVTGQAEYPDTLEEYIRASDEMLYHAKHTGRNRYDFKRLQLYSTRTGKEHSDYENRLNATINEVSKNPLLTAGVTREAAAILAETCCKALNTSHVGVWTTTKNGKVLKNMTSYDSAAYEHCVQNDFDVASRGEYIQNMTDENILVIPDLSQPNILYNMDDYDYSLCATLDVSVKVKGELVGIICIEQSKTDEYPHCRDWTEVEQRFASSIANLMASALE